MTKRLRLAYLAHLPECDFERYGVRFNRERAAGNIKGGAFSTIEGAFLQGFLEQGGLDIHVISFSPFVSEAQQIRVSDGLTIYLLPAAKFTGMSVAWIPRMLQVRRLLQKIKPDVVHGMRNIEGYGLMAVCSGFPHVVTIEEFFEGIPYPPHMKWSFWIARQVERWVVKKAKNLVAISLHVKKTLLTMGARGKIDVIPNVAADIFYTVVKKAPRHLLFVGRISPEKGLLDVIHALALDECKAISPKLVVVGGSSGPEGEAYLKLCKESAANTLAATQVEFRGWLQTHEVAKLHEEAYALIMTSTAKYEGMGVVIVEALAAGTPVITYDFGPMPELVCNGKTGYVISVGNISAMADAIIDSHQSAESNFQSIDVYRSAAAIYTTEEVTRCYLKLFKKIYDKKHSA